MENSKVLQMNLLFLNIDFNFPIENPVIIFFLILTIILLTPILFNKIKIPHLIGLIIIGAIIGPHSLNLLQRDSSMVLFGTVGLIYIMFLAGLETSMSDFIKNSKRSFIFGLMTFSIPMILGTLAGIYLLHFSMITSVLLASMFASNTLVTYPILIKFGVTKNRAATMAVGGTIITDILALLILAVIADISTGTLSNIFWLRIGISMVLLTSIILFIFPIIGRWFFKKNEDNISQFIFSLSLVFFAGLLSLLAGMEAIIGAFMAGIALTELIPRTSPLMNRIGFVGNALFIPFFLISVGMLVDYKILFTDSATILVAMVMTIVAIIGKYLPAYLAQKLFKYSVAERRIAFGLTNSQAAATLAAVMVGYNIILGTTESGEPIRLLNDSVLNGTIFMILVTCTLAAFVTQKGAKEIAQISVDEKEKKPKENNLYERILIPIGNPDTIEELVQLGTLLRTDKNSSIIGLNIITSDKSVAESEKSANQILEKAVMAASASDTHLHKLIRHDVNASNGIVNVVKEQKITDIILGLHIRKSIADSFLGTLTESVLTKCNASAYIYQCMQPLSTVKRFHVIVPDKAEKETGFLRWIYKISNLSINTSSALVFYSTEKTIEAIKNTNFFLLPNVKYVITPRFSDFQEQILKENDALIIIMARTNSVSYSPYMLKVSSYLNKVFCKYNFIIVYPLQYDYSEYNEIDYKNPEEFEPIRQQLEKVDDLMGRIKKQYKRGN